MAYRKAIELDPGVGGYWSNLGLLFAKEPERAAEAEMAHRKAIELDPTSADFWLKLGSSLQQNQSEPLTRKWRAVRQSN
jgi:cytochrome c-type biogenesis protein CcmH/NrfG